MGFVSSLPFARPAVAALRATPVWLDAIGQSLKDEPCIVFLPAKDASDGACRLRHIEMARRLRRFGWRTVVLPWRLNLIHRKRLLEAIDPDLVIMQGARHALNRPALYPGRRIVFDMDDADFYLPHLAHPVARAMPQVHSVIAGSEFIADWCRRAGAPEVAVVWTGTPVSPRPLTPHAMRAPVVAWAQTAPLTYGGELEFVDAVMCRLAEQVPDVRLRVYDRPTDGTQWPGAGYRVEWMPRMDYASYLQSFDDVAIGLAPLSDASPFSRGKSFGKLLAYLDRGVPSLVSTTGEPARFFDATTGVVSDGVDQWVAAIVRLLKDPTARDQMATEAHNAFRRRLSIDAAAAETDRVLRRCLPAAPRRVRA